MTHNKVFLGDDYLKIENVKICVCGAGALGSNLIMALAQEGYQHIDVIDFDRVEKDNAYTQIYGIRDNGAKKVQALRGIIAKKLGLNIGIQDIKLTEQNVKKLLQGYNLIVDTFDNWESRALVQNFCIQKSIHCVHAGMNENGYSEIRWKDTYNISKYNIEQKDLCVYPLAGPLVHMTVAILQTVVTHYVITRKQISRSFSLRDITLHNF